ncbi:hypothetical protein GMA12_02055 [Kocuria sediminis]|uniref:Uncharacterized protein n=1 Tax=Kocuria sediminis TaxID=1038857 RepID=A0A6N8GI57_9MICC|nr:hypothetical protein [Kocuria sediminis]MUN61940.1 hypothetical protein [Kocuria sediminis]
MSGNDETRDDGTRDDGTRDDGQPAPSGPAPIIDLGGGAVPVRPVKPLGPRRLARLQRELAERSRELEQTGGGPADPELLEKQRRFAELAAQAEQANAPSAGGAGVPAHVSAQPPVAQPAPVEPAPAEPTPGEPTTPGETEQITVVFPGADGPAGADGHVGHDPVHVDPSLFSNRLAPEELAALTHIEILAPAEHHGSHAAVPEDPGDTTAPQSAPPAAPSENAPSATALPEPVGAWPEAEEEPEPPAAPVPATAAGGLELLEPREYRRGAGGRWLGLLLLVLLAALAVVLVLFVL